MKLDCLRSSGLATLLLVTALSACETSRPSADLGGPTLILESTITIAENDTLYVARPRDITIDRSTGGIFVADMFFDRVLEIDGTGRILRSYGNRGDGPTEIRQIGPLISTSREVIAVSGKRSMVIVFDRSTGQAIRIRRLNGYLAFAANDDEQTWYYALDLSKRQSVISWDRSTDLAMTLVAIPDVYSKSPPLAGIYGAGTIALWKDTVTVGFSGTEYLVRTGVEGIPVDTLWIPKRLRRGVPDDLLQQLSTTKWPRLFSLASFLMYTAYMPDGRLLTVHYDQEIDKARNISAKPYVSILDPHAEKACVDGVIPGLSGETQPALTLHVDTLIVVDQQPTALAVRTTIGKYLISDRNCNWLPLRRVKAKERVPE